MNLKMAHKDELQKIKTLFYSPEGLRAGPAVCLQVCEGTLVVDRENQLANFVDGDGLDRGIPLSQVAFVGV